MQRSTWQAISRPLRSLRTEAANRICEWFDGYATRSTSNTKIAAGAAIAAREMLDIPRAVGAPSLPIQVESTLANFTPDEWEEVMRIAAGDRHWLETELQKPQWAHLRRRPDV